MTEPPSDSRLPPVTSRTDVPEDERHHFDAIAESRGSVRGPFTVLMHSPEVAGRVGHLGAYIRYESELPGEVRELAILTTARAFDCAYEWAAHEPIAREAGVPSETIDVVAEREDPSALTEREATVVRYGRELFGDHAVSDETFAAAREAFGESGVTELTATMGYYSLIACVLNAFEVLPDEGAPSLPRSP